MGTLGSMFARLFGPRAHQVSCGPPQPSTSTSSLPALPPHAAPNADSSSGKTRRKSGNLLPALPTIPKSSERSAAPRRTSRSRKPSFNIGLSYKSFFGMDSPDMYEESAVDGLRSSREASSAAAPPSRRSSEPLDSKFNWTFGRSDVGVASASSPVRSPPPPPGPPPSSPSSPAGLRDGGWGLTGVSSSSSAIPEIAEGKVVGGRGGGRGEKALAPSPNSAFYEPVKKRERKGSGEKTETETWD